MTPPAVLILDDDLGFCMWLGRILNQAGIHALPASRSEEALEIAVDPSYCIELVIVNPDIERCDEVLERNRQARVISIGEPGMLRVQGTLQRPQGESLPPPEHYVKAVRDVLNQPGTC